MTARITCVHTAASNVAVFDRAAHGMDVPLRHVVRPDLLSAALAAGGLTPEIAADTLAELHARRAEGGVVLLTCSTLGRAAEGAGAGIMRADAALARAAVARGGRLVVLYTAPTTREPTEKLFRAAAAAGGTAMVEFHLVDQAWARSLAGDADGYESLIARAIEAARADTIALAQVSMAGAIDRVQGGCPVLSVATAAIGAARHDFGREQDVQLQLKVVHCARV